MITKKALIVDDSKLAQFVLKNMLVQYKFDVDTAESAEEALGYLSHQKPDVIFMDHTMPGMDGLQALKVIKDNPDTAAIPIMMYTSQSDGVYINQAKELGAADILPKQLKPLELQHVLEKLHLIGDHTNVKQVPAKKSVRPFTIEKQTVAASETEELTRLLREAESALEKETLKQFVQQELEKQHRRFAIILQKISHGLSDLANTRTGLKAETATPSTARLSGLLWPLLFVVVILVFGLLYFRLEQSLSSLQHIYANSAAGANTINQASPRTKAEIPDNRQINALLATLENVINADSAVPLEEPLLSERIMQKILAIIGPLSTAAFRGEVQIIAHTGNFCLRSNAANERIIPAANTPIGQCQIIESVTTTEQMMTAEFRDFITGINDHKNNGFYITVSSQGGSQPLVNYPNIDTSITAGKWNAIAQKNRRVEIMLKSGG
jgi:CheY-like chemotaxis protein